MNANQPKEAVALEAFFEAIIKGTGIVDAQHNPGRTLNHFQKCFEAGLKLMDIPAGPTSKIYRAVRGREKKKRGRKK